MKISFIMPGRDNLVYAKWSYESIRKHQKTHEVEICFADDNSSDGTWEWCIEMMKIDPLFKAIRNDSGKRLGHTILYDRLINEVCTSEVAMIWHCDMYLCPGALDEIERLMYDQGDTSPSSTEPYIPLIITNPDGSWNYMPNYKTIVSLTRIEPPLHPDGPEKYLADWGTEPDQFNEIDFLNWFKNGYKPKYSPPYTNGIFAPWAFFVEDFKKIGGHDPLYKPQSKEDSDIFNRFKLNGCKFIQTWLGCVYHITCRGSRFNPTLTTPGTNSLEWEAHNIRSARNFIRKWGSFVEHTPLMDPIITPKYYTRYNIINCTKSLIELIEPWADLIRCDLDPKLLNEYCDKESKYTDFDLGMKFNYQGLVPSVTVAIDGNHFGNDEYQYLQLLPKIVQDTLLNKKSTEGTFKLGSLFVQISNNEEMTNTLIHVDNEEYQSRLRR